MIQVQETVNGRGLQHNQVSVGTTPMPLTVSTQKVVKGVRLVAAVDNSSVIYVGDKCVTVLTGYPLLPGEFLEVPCDNANDIFTVASEPQNAAWIGI